MSETTIYTFADWWNPRLWRWWPRFEHIGPNVYCNFLCFSIRREFLL